MGRLRAEGRTGPLVVCESAEPRHPAMDWDRFRRDEDAADYKIASSAIDALRRRPGPAVFHRVRFRLPHALLCAAKWFDLHPEATLRMPPDPGRSADTPRFSRIRTDVAGAALQTLGAQ